MDGRCCRKTAINAAQQMVWRKSLGSDIVRKCQYRCTKLPATLHKKPRPIPRQGRRRSRSPKALLTKPSRSPRKMTAPMPQAGLCAGRSTSCRTTDSFRDRNNPLPFSWRVALELCHKGKAKTRKKTKKGSGHRDPEPFHPDDQEWRSGAGSA